MGNIIEKGFTLLCFVILDIQMAILSAKWHKVFPDSAPNLDLLFKMDEEERRKRGKM